MSARPLYSTWVEPRCAGTTFHPLLSAHGSSSDSAPRQRGNSETSHPLPCSFGTAQPRLMCHSRNLCWLLSRQFCWFVCVWFYLEVSLVPWFMWSSSGLPVFTFDALIGILLDYNSRGLYRCICLAGPILLLLFVFLCPGVKLALTLGINTSKDSIFVVFSF